MGTFSGSGLSQGGDGATLWISAGAPTDATPVADFEEYPDAELFGGQSYDVDQAAFSGDLDGTISSVIANDESQPAIASPGYLVPEPASLALLAAGGLFMARRRK